MRIWRASRLALSFCSLLVVFAEVASGDDGCPPCPPAVQCPPTQQVPPSMTTAPPGGSEETGRAPETTMPAQTFPAAAGENFADLGASRNAYEQSNISVAGSGLASAALTTGTQTFSSTLANSTILPGLLTSANAQSPIPTDRVFFNYAFDDQFQFVQSQLVATNTSSGKATTSQIAGFNLNQFDVGVEKSLFGGMASIYVDAPILYATDNVTGQSINGFGDLNAGFKVRLLYDCKTNDALSAGMTVSVPTAHAGQFEQAILLRTDEPGTPIQTTPVNVFKTALNPTFVQPWVAGLVNFNRLFVQEYFAVIQPLPDEVATSINDSLTVGYRLWTADPCNQDNHWISSITPILSAQTLVALQNGFNETKNVSSATTPEVTPGPFRISFPTQVFLTEGCEFGVGRRATVFGGVVEPVASPKAFTIGATAGVNFYF
jgi:hypothetical protein